MVAAAVRAATTSRSFADAFAEVHADCVRLAWHLTSSREDAEDIAADVLAATWERYERGKIDESATRSPDTPITRHSGSTTLIGSSTAPILQVPQG